MGKHKKFNKDGIQIPKQSRQVAHGYGTGYNNKIVVKLEQSVEKRPYRESIDNTTPLRELYPTAKFIKNWKELSECGVESETHVLEVELDYGSGSIDQKKNLTDTQLGNFDQSLFSGHNYLSTHTFYGDPPSEKRKHYNYRRSTRLLQKCGFNVILRGDCGDEDQYEEGCLDGK